MNFDWQEYVELAEFVISIKGKHSQEASERCAVSRAYYSSFCHLRNYAIQNKGFQPTADPNKRGQDHRRLREHISKQCKRNEIARELETLHRNRKRCDYEDQVPHTDVMSKESIECSRRLNTSIPW